MPNDGDSEFRVATAAKTLDRIFFVLFTMGHEPKVDFVTEFWEDLL